MSFAYSFMYNKFIWLHFIFTILLEIFHLFVSCNHKCFISSNTFIHGCIVFIIHGPVNILQIRNPALYLIDKAEKLGTHMGIESTSPAFKGRMLTATP